MFSGSKWENPSSLPCFVACSSCFRCEDKGKYDKCNRCSGRHDVKAQRDPYDIDDRCRCKEGLLQYRTQDGRMLKRRFESDPFKGKVTTDAETQDEQEWNQYVSEQREKYNDPTFDPITFNDGTSTTDYVNRSKNQGHP